MAVMKSPKKIQGKFKNKGKCMIFVGYTDKYPHTNSDTGQATPRIEMDCGTPAPPGTRELRNLAEPSIWDAPRQDAAKEEGRVLRSMVEPSQDTGNITMDEFFGNIALITKDPETMVDTSKDTSGYDYRSQNGKGGIREHPIEIQTFQGNERCGYGIT